MSAALPSLAQENDADPYVWLEEVTGEEALNWVRARNAESTAELAQTAEFNALYQRLLAILDSDARIPYIRKQGNFFYNFWRDAKNKRGLWRRTSLEEYRKPAPAWEIVLDLDALATQENENWVWGGATFLHPECKRCLISLSRGGADAHVIREFDVIEKAFVPGGFVLPEAKSRVAWRHLDSLYVATDFGPGSLTDSGYPRVVKEWKRGTPLAEAATVFEGRKQDTSASAWRDLTRGFERDFVQRQITFWTSELFLRRDGKLIPIEKPADAVASVHRQWLLLELRSDWKPADKNYRAGSLLAAPLEDFLAGARAFDVLFEPAERLSLASFTPTLNYILVNELDNVRNRLYVLTPPAAGAQGWRREPLPGIPAIGTISVTAVDDEESDDFFLNVSSYLAPASLSLSSVGRPTAEKLKQLPEFFNAQGLQVQQREAISRDGTRVPYFQVGPTDPHVPGPRPTLLYGYGGFEISMLPSYQATTGAAWLEHGGVYVVANIRGGGEFGPAWHQAALKANRHKAYEDFEAVAEDLIRRGVTTPKHLGIMGGSNGGLLMGNMLTRRPDLFGAIVCQVPLLDMRRYHKLLAGASWVAEYGNPDLPDEWHFIRTFSPYHNVQPHIKYPRVLFTTSTRDDRVHPGHARKLVAKMRDQGHDVLYYENIEGGHGGAANNQQAAFMWALAYRFLWNQLKQ